MQLLLPRPKRSLLSLTAESREQQWCHSPE
uniref:Uncharacterized protein n=1 Tax=Arundo donax TaxID=35708 RepID=A0A0A8ZZB6_ARUDO